PVPEISPKELELLRKQIRQVRQYAPIEEGCVYPGSAFLYIEEEVGNRTYGPKPVELAVDLIPYSQISTQHPILYDRTISAATEVVLPQIAAAYKDHLGGIVAYEVMLRGSGKNRISFKGRVYVSARTMVYKVQSRIQK
ncbi:MAG: hypothetical protein Q7R44_01045, partial [bacterium]|nr:hypothetical protein [bacterium]